MNNDRSQVTVKTVTVITQYVHQSLAQAHSENCIIRSIPEGKGDRKEIVLCEWAGTCECQGHPQISSRGWG